MGRTLSCPTLLFTTNYIQHTPMISTSSKPIHTSAIPFFNGVQSLASDKATGKPNINVIIINFFKWLNKIQAGLFTLLVVFRYPNNVEWNTLCV